MPRTTFIPRRSVLAAALTVPAALLTGVTAGCNVIGTIAHKAAPPPRHAAAHTLAAEPTLVIVERRANPGEAGQASQQVAEEVTRLLRANGVPHVLDPGLAVEARSRPGPGGTLPRPTEIARACGAAQVVYVDLTRYAASSALNGDAVAGEAEAAVWVVDARTAQPRWPAESGQGHPVAAAVPFQPAAAGGTTEQQVRDQMHRELALRVARLFYTWTEE